MSTFRPRPAEEFRFTDITYQKKDWVATVTSSAGSSTGRRRRWICRRACSGFDREGRLAFFKVAKDPDGARPGPKILAPAGSSAELYGWERVRVKPPRVDGSCRRAPKGLNRKG